MSGSSHSKSGATWRTDGSVLIVDDSETARLAGLSRGHLHRKVRQLGLDPERFRERKPEA